MHAYIQQGNIIDLSQSFNDTTKCLREINHKQDLLLISRPAMNHELKVKLNLNYHFLILYCHLCNWIKMPFNDRINGVWYWLHSASIESSVLQEKENVLMTSHYICYHNLHLWLIRDIEKACMIYKYRLLSYFYVRIAIGV